MDKNDEDRNGAPAKGCLNVSATPPLPPVDGRGPNYKDQVLVQHSHRRPDDPPPQEKQADGILVRDDQRHRAGPHFKDQARNVAATAATRESPARQTEQVQPSPTDLPLAAQVVADVDEQELEERIRRRILEGAAEAQVVTPSQLRRDSNHCSCKNQKVLLYIVLGLALLAGVVLGVVLPWTLTNEKANASRNQDITTSPSSMNMIQPSLSPPTTTPAQESLPNSISPRPTTSPAPTSSPPVPVTVEILLDSNPDETGWKIECGDDDVAYADYPFRTYAPTQAMVTETVLVPAGASCRFTLSDAEGDGLYACCDENGDRLPEDRYFVYLGSNSTAALGNLVVAGSGDFGYEMVHNFTATLLISLNTTTLPPTISPRPTQSPAPTLAPTVADWNLLGNNGDCSVVGAESSVLCNDQFGWPAEISADGNVIAMTGRVDFTRILTLDEESNIWRQRGQDIQGFADDNREKYLALSGTGNVVAIGNTFTVSSGLPGAVRVFRYNSQGNSWSQIGSTLDGLANVDEWFSPTSLSHNENIIAVGERERYLGDGEPSFGRARAYRYNESAADWLQLGQDINGDEADDWFGNSVSLSNDGYVMAVGAPFYGSEANGQARIFHYNNTSNEWKLLGQPIEGAEESTELGWVVSMSGDGSTFAVGTYAGFVLVYRLDSTKSTWLQLGQKLTEQDTGTSNGGVFGISVTLSYDGSRLGIGNSAGPAVVLEYDNSSESWKQLGPAVYNRNSNETSSISVSISDDGRRIVVGGEFVSVFQKN